jgi:hypothetical protein
LRLEKTSKRHILRSYRLMYAALRIDAVVPELFAGLPDG